MTVAELLARISGRELAEWEALYAVEAEERARAATQAGLRADATAGLSARRRPRRR